MRHTPLLFILMSLVWLACSGDDPVENERETYVGEAYIDKGLDSVGGETIDTVMFIVESPFYSLSNLTDKANLCDSEGEVYGFGKPVMRFEPSLTFGQNCDSVRVPHGEFDAQFVGDTLLILTRIDYVLSIEYRYNLYLR